MSSVASATPSSRAGDVPRRRARITRQARKQSTIVANTAACCRKESSVSASSTVHIGARTVYASGCTSLASVTAPCDSALTIGVAVAKAVAISKPQVPAQITSQARERARRVFTRDQSTRRRRMH